VVGLTAKAAGVSSKEDVEVVGELGSARLVDGPSLASSSKLHLYLDQIGIPMLLIDSVEALWKLGR